MALRVYMERSPNDRNAVHLFHGGASSMSNPFDNVSDEILAGWWKIFGNVQLVINQAVKVAFTMKTNVVKLVFITSVLKWSQSLI